MDLFEFQNFKFSLPLFNYPWVKTTRLEMPDALLVLPVSLGYQCIEHVPLNPTRQITTAWLSSGDQQQQRRVALFA